MARTHFSEGEKPTLEEVLRTREMRMKYQNKLATSHGGHSVLSFKLNIPGPVKNNKTIEWIFRYGTERIEDMLKSESKNVLFRKEIHLSTGPELFLVIEDSGESLKKNTVVLEEEDPLGRLFDIDVLVLQEQSIRMFQRQEFGYPERECLICGCSSKACGRNRTHSIEELHEKMEEILRSVPQFAEITDHPGASLTNDKEDSLWYN